MGKGKQTSTTVSQPWAPAQPYLKGGLSELTSLYDAGGMTTDYSGDWVANMTGGQDAALRNIIGTAGMSNSALAGMAGGLSGLASGDQTTGNWNTISQNVIQDLMPSINSTFAGSGMTGSTLHQQNLSKGLGQGLATAYNDYAQQQVENQMGATSSIANLLAQIGGNAQTALGAEDKYQAQTQNELDSQYQNSILQQNADYEALSNYMNLISGVAGLGGTSTGTQKSSAGIGGILGGIASIASLF